jgi:predicted lysophospholipase L1 biosynthesis ABC-type transport system permease subunit
VICPVFYQPLSPFHLCLTLIPFRFSLTAFWYPTFVVWIKLLHVILIVSTLLIVGVAGACYWRYRRHMKASDAPLRGALDELEKQPKIGEK